MVKRFIIVIRIYNIIINDIFNSINGSIAIVVCLKYRFFYYNWRNKSNRAYKAAVVASINIKSAK